MAAKYGAPFFEMVGKNPLLAAAIGAPLATAGVSAAQYGISRLMDARAKAQSFKGMLELHPKLQKRDSAEVSRIFNSLHRINPMLGNDPLVAGAWVDHVMEQNDTFAGSGSSRQGLLAAVTNLSSITGQLAKAHEKRGPDYGTMIGKSIMDVGGALQHAQEAETKGLLDASKVVQDRVNRAEQYERVVEDKAQARAAGERYGRRVEEPEPGHVYHAEPLHSPVVVSGPVPPSKPSYQVPSWGPQPKRRKP